ncbi:MAG: hypothetical protein MSM72_03055 [Firmicutes bacterium]|nr:hypothetical protein [Bacillota bacterium]
MGGKLGSGAVAATDKNVSIFSGLRHPAASPAKRAGARLEVRSTAVSAYAGSSVQLAADAQFLCIPRTLFNKILRCVRLCSFKRYFGSHLYTKSAFFLGISGKFCNYIVTNRIFGQIPA